MSLLRVGWNVCLEVMLVTACASGASAQSLEYGSLLQLSSQFKSFHLTFPPGSLTSNGYSSATADIRYKFVICGSDIAVRYLSGSGAVATSSYYWISGQKVSIPANSLSTFWLDLTGLVLENDVQIGTVRSRVTASGNGKDDCSVPIERIGKLRDYVGPKAIASQTQYFLDSLSLQFPEPDAPFHNQGFESKFVASVSPVASPAAVNSAQTLNAANRVRQNNIIAQNGAAIREYAQKLEQSKMAMDEFQIKRTEYEKDLAAARKARADYEQQYGTKPARE